MLLLLILVLVIDLWWGLLSHDSGQQSVPQKSNQNEQPFDRSIRTTSKLEIIRLGNFPNSSDHITIVTTLFRLDYPKSTNRSWKNHSTWVHTMLKSLSSPFVAYVDKHSARLFQNYFAKPTTTSKRLRGVLLVATSIWDVMDELATVRNRSYRNEYQNRQARFNHDNNENSPDLNAFNNLKIYMIYQAANWNPFKSEFFIFVDCELWTPPENVHFHNWPNVEFTSHVANLLADRVLFAQLLELADWKEDSSRRQEVIHSGFLAGSFSVLSSLYESFYVAHDFWIDQGRYVGKNQQFLIKLAFNSFMANRATRLRSFNLNCSPVVENDLRRFFLFYFAESEQYYCLEDKFKLINL